MKTTLTLDPDVRKAAKSLADAKSMSLGAVVSELARRGWELARSEHPERVPHFAVPPEARVMLLPDGSPLRRHVRLLNPETAWPATQR